MAYITYADMYEEFGYTNILKWGKNVPDVTISDIQDHVDAVCEEMSALLDDMLRDGMYVVPLTPADSPVIKRIVRGLVVEQLRSGRVDEESPWLLSRIKEARDMVAKIQSGEQLLPCTRHRYASTVPYISTSNG